MKILCRPRDFKNDIECTERRHIIISAREYGIFARYTSHVTLPFAPFLDVNIFVYIVSSQL